MRRPHPDVRSPGRWHPWRSPLAATLIATSLLTGCGGAGGRVPVATFQRRLESQEHLTPAQARCVSRYAYAEYNSESIHILATQGLQSLPQNLWTNYLHSMAACTLHSQLGRAGLLPRSAGSTPPA